MSTASQRTIHALEHIVKRAPIGTNLALLHLLWSIMRGAFLESRGALFPALQIAGLTVGQIRRCGQALRTGAWTVASLVERWNCYVLDQGDWQSNSYDGYRPVAVDLTTFWRPRLHGWLSKFYHRIANRACKGIGIGLVVQVGQIGVERIPSVRQILCSRNGESEADLQYRTLQTAGRCLDEQEVLLHDAGTSIAELQKAAVPRYVVRMALNCTGRRNVLPEYKGTGRPSEYGEKVRPLPRLYDGHSIAATPPDLMTSFTHQERTLCVYGWQDLVRSDQKVDAKQETFHLWVFFDPIYHDPLVVGTNLVMADCQTVFRLYLDRWPVEQVPLVAKQTLGLHRQFVFSPQSRLRLPALALLAANVLTHLAAALPPLATGFWDRSPKRSPGRLRRALKQEGFPNEYALKGQLRKKQAQTRHLPKGIDAHRRQKAVP